jgi:hypothetical protein
MNTRHQRFPLHDVTFAGAPIAGATMDLWQDENQHTQWTARVVVRTAPTADEGELTGLTRDGRLLRGQVVIADRQMGPGGRRETLIEFHGVGDLQGLDGDPAS